MSQDNNIYISTMVHEAVVIVDENGTEAAAVSMAISKNFSHPEPSKPIVFYANRSFVYYIRHMSTNTILFLGDYQGQ